MFAMLRSILAKYRSRISGVVVTGAGAANAARRPRAYTASETVSRGVARGFQRETAETMPPPPPRRRGEGGGEAEDARGWIAREVESASPGAEGGGGEACADAIATSDLRDASRSRPRASLRPG